MVDAGAAVEDAELAEEVAVETDSRAELAEIVKQQAERTTIRREEDEFEAITTSSKPTMGNSRIREIANDLSKEISNLVNSNRGIKAVRTASGITTTTITGTKACVEDGSSVEEIVIGHMAATASGTVLR